MRFFTPVALVLCLLTTCTQAGLQNALNTALIGLRPININPGILLRPHGTSYSSPRVRYSSIRSLRRGASLCFEAALNSRMIPRPGVWRLLSRRCSVLLMSSVFVKPILPTQ